VRKVFNVSDLAVGAAAVVCWRLPPKPSFYYEQLVVMSCGCRKSSAIPLNSESWRDYVTMIYTYTRYPYQDPYISSPHSSSVLCSIEILQRQYKVVHGLIIVAPIF
jgi:hypothetical protein